MSAPSHEPQPGAGPSVSPFMRVLAVVMLVLPAVGLAANVVLLIGGSEAWAKGYHRSGILAAGMVLAVADLFGSYFHYRRTRMGINVVSRILANAWLLSAILLLWRTYRAG